MKKKKNILENKFIYWLVCHIGFYITRFICQSVHIHEYQKEGAEDLFKSGGMFFIWHRTLMIPIYANRNSQVTTLAAKSPDGGIQAFICEKFGYFVERGSSKRGGVPGLLRLIKVLEKNRPVALTVDGPIGPAEKCQPGAAMMIAKTSLPFCAIGVAIDKKWVFKKSWDGFQIPKPLSHAYIYYSKPIYLESNLSKEEILKKVEDSIKLSSEKAEYLLRKDNNGR